MKILKAVLITILFTIIFGTFLFKVNESVTVSSEMDIYIKVENITTKLYVDKDLSSPVFLLPESYYVKVLSKEEKSYFVEYKGIKGYIPQENTTLYYDIVSPYPEEIILNITTSTDLKQSPDSISKSIKVLNCNDTIIFIGSITGEQISDDLGNIWYYVKANDIYGYIYAPFTSGAGGRLLNNQYGDKLEIKYSEISEITAGDKNLIAIMLFLPTVALLYLLLTKRFNN